MLIVIQRGHVPRSTGATGAPGEQQFAIETARRCEYHLRRVGHGVRIIDADESPSRYAGDAFFAIHYDSSRSPGATGASVGYQTAEGGQVGRYWKAHYAQNGWTNGFRPDNYTNALAEYYGVRKAVAAGNRRAIITEAGFHTNAPDPDPQLEDSQLLRSPAGPDRVAIAIAATVVDLFGGAKCPPTPGITSFPGTVKMGDRGAAVRTWQSEFNKKGYKLGVDGVFGPATNHVVVDFQRKRGLVRDGVAGPATWHALILG